MGTLYRVRPDPEIRKAADLMIDKMIAQLAPGHEVLATIHPKTVEDRMITLTVRGPSAGTRRPGTKDPQADRAADGDFE
jgi:hypothetical protein